MNATIDVTGIRIETDRLILRPWREDDLEDLYAYASVPGVGEMAGWCHHKSREDSLVVLLMFICGKRTLALERKECGRVIGSLGLEELGVDPETDKLGREIGYVLSREYWGRGLAPEAVRAVIDYCFRVLDFDFLTCSHFLRNHQSRRVIEKCGFAYFSDAQFEMRYETVELTRNYILYNPNKE